MASRSLKMKKKKTLSQDVKQILRILIFCFQLIYFIFINKEIISCTVVETLWILLKMYS